MLDSGPDGGDCPPVGLCRGFPGNCADLPDQFAALPVLPDYPNGLAEYTCHAFPDEDIQLDSFLVGLISIAIALPVGSFIAQCFGIANDSEAPESLLEWSGWPKLLLGPTANRRWLYSGPAGPPRRFIKWYVRSVTAPQPETLINLCHSLRCWLTGAELPWATEWREAQDEAAAAIAEEDGDDGAKGSEGGSEGGETSSSVRSAQSLSTYKRTVMLTGFIGTYVTWAVFAWFIFVRFCAACARAAAGAAPHAHLLALAAPRRLRADVWHAHLQAARGRGAERVRAQLGHQLWHECGDGVAGHRVRGGARHRDSHHPGASLPHTQQRMAGGAARLATQLLRDAWMLRAASSGHAG